MSGDVIKEFLVALGFKVDEKGLQKFNTGIGKATKVAATLGAAAFSAAAAVEASVIKIAGDLDRLYFASKRTQTSANNIKAFGYAATQLGGSVEGALGSLENFSAFIRNTPAAESFLKGLGVNSRDSTGRMRENLDILKDVGTALAALRDKTGSNGLSMAYASRLGIDEKTLLALEDGSLIEKMRQYDEIQKKLGYDANKASKEFHNFEVNGVQPLTSRFDIMTTKIAERFLPLAELITKALTKLIDAFAWLDKKTGGITMVFTVIIAVVGAVMLALLAIGVGISGTFALLIAGAIALGVALGAAAAYVINHWNDVKAWFADFFGWFEKKWKAVTDTYDKVYYKLHPNAPGAPHPARVGDVANDPNWKPSGAEGNDQQQAGGSQAKQGRGSKEAAITFFTQMGWTSAQAAGIVANLIHESNLDPNAVGDKGQARGLAQWHPDRQREFARVFGKELKDSTFEEQLQFIQHELTQGNEKRAGNALALQQTERGAADVVNRLYERSADLNRNSYLRGNTAEMLVGSQTGKSATIHQKTDIHVTGSGDARATAAEVSRQQGWVNSNLIRNTESVMT